MNNDYTNNHSHQQQPEVTDQALFERISIGQTAMRMSQQQELDRIRLVQREQSQLQVERLQRVQHAARLALQRSQEQELQQLQRQMDEDNDEEIRRYQEAFENELEMFENQMRTRQANNYSKIYQTNPQPSSLNDAINDLEQRLRELAQVLNEEERETDEDESVLDDEEESDDPNWDQRMQEGESDSEWDTDSDESAFDEEESDDSLDFYFDGEESAAAVRERINELRNENEQSASKCLRFSRACGICYSASPLQRAVFSSCGHALCLACAEQHRANPPIDGERGLDCPFCRCKGGFVKLFEDLIEGEPVFDE